MSKLMELVQNGAFPVFFFLFYELDVKGSVFFLRGLVGMEWVWG